MYWKWENWDLPRVTQVVNEGIGSQIKILWCQKYFFHYVKLRVLTSHGQRFQLREEVFMLIDWTGMVLGSDATVWSGQMGWRGHFSVWFVYEVLLYPTLDLVDMTGSTSRKVISEVWNEGWPLRGLGLEDWLQQSLKGPWEKWKWQDCGIEGLRAVFGKGWVVSLMDS